MKLSEAAKLYDNLQKTVNSGHITAEMITRGCKALIKLNKVASFTVPYINYGFSLSLSWKNGHHNVELRISNYSQQIQFFYRNFYNNIFHAYDFNCEEPIPIPQVIINAFKFFAED